MVNLQNSRVILIGGTSHAGKSTLAESLASRRGWSYRSTDQLARHPGRPWKTPPQTVPDHVVAHYRSLPVEELTAAVVRHFTQNVWPLAEEIIAFHASDAAKGGLVLEGSALLPELAETVLNENVAAVWLTASRAFLTQRMYRESDYENKSALERELIDTFLERTVRFDERVVETVSRKGLILINVEAASNLDELVEVCFSELQKHR